MKNILISCLALILFVSCQTTSGVIQENPVTVIVVPDPEPEPQQTRVYSGLILPNGVSTRNTERGKILVSDKKIIFPFGKATLPNDASYILKDVVKYILDNNPDVRIVLEAHTSNKGISYPYNYALSLQRSSVGEKYLSTLGVTSERLMTKSYGESLPEYPEQKDLRRYEFVVIENDEDLMKYNKFFSTVNAQADMTYSIYIKRVKAYEQRNSDISSGDDNNTAVFNYDTYESEKVIADEERYVNENNTYRAKEVFTPDVNNDEGRVDTDDEEYADDNMFIDDDILIVN